MLRKDVKLGFAIGGIMLAVVIVYVLVVPSGDKKNVTVATDDSQGKADVAQSPASTENKIADPETTSSANAPPADPSKAVTEQAPANSQLGTKAGSQSDSQANGQSSLPSGNPSAVSPAASGKPAGGVSDWNKLLAEGSSSPTMMSETPTFDAKHPAAAADSASTSAPDTISAPDKATVDQPVVDSTASPAEKATPDLSIDTASSPATQPADSGQRIHVVQSGEMLTSIASAAYGDSRKWKRIAEANPNVNPNRLAPGTKLIIPALKTSSESDAGAVLASAKLDSQTRYEVQPNDSLYRISLKLYGKADHVDKLYDANKETIGSDPKRLKLHMVLKLTDPPTSGTANTASR